jgi:hypothetical protein
VLVGGGGRVAGRGGSTGAGMKDRSEKWMRFSFSGFRSSFSTGFFTKFIARASRGKGRARGSQSGDIWTREETLELELL